MTLNLRGIPTAACPNCGSTLFNINASFDVETYEIEMYRMSESPVKVRSEMPKDILSVGSSDF